MKRTVTLIDGRGLALWLESGKACGEWWPVSRSSGLGWFSVGQQAECRMVMKVNGT
jgi:hypothetical protein